MAPECQGEVFLFAEFFAPITQVVFSSPLFALVSVGLYLGCSWFPFKVSSLHVFYKIIYFSAKYCGKRHLNIHIHSDPIVTCSTEEDIDQKYYNKSFLLTKM